MREDIVHLCEERGCLLEPQALERVLQMDDPVSFLKRRLQPESVSPGILTAEYLFDRASGAKPAASPVSPMQKAPPGPAVPEHLEEVSLPDDYATDEVYLVNGKVDEFVEYFRDRYMRISSMFRNKVGVGNLVADPNPEESGELSFVGMVQRMWMSRSNKPMMAVDTSERTITVMLDAKANDTGTTVIEDDIVCLTGGFLNDGGKRRGKYSDPLFYARRIQWPGIPVMNRPRNWKEEAYAAFIGDIHVGSRNFLKEQWDTFVEWLNSGEGVPGKIRHLVIAGDLVDGVGVYPDQKNDLELHTFEEQYRRLGDMLEDIPEHIEIHAIPGNHDAVPLHEPQPPIPFEYQKLIRRKVNYLRNPAWLDLDGYHVLVYHGGSIFDFISAVPSVTIQNPLEAMKEMLTRRHLAPHFGGHTPLLPLKKDHLVIDRVPNVLVTGHLHSCAANIYRGVVLINASTWQSQTSYQKTQNFNPDPAKVVVVNLQKGTPAIADFMT